MVYKITDIETITGGNDDGRLFVSIKGQASTIECYIVEFNHDDGTVELIVLR